VHRKETIDTTVRLPDGLLTNRLDQILCYKAQHGMYLAIHCFTASDMGLYGALVQPCNNNNNNNNNNNTKNNKNNNNNVLSITAIVINK